MRCPVCSHDDTRVIDSRVSGDGQSIRRRRECVKCDYRFSTLEDVEIFDLMLVKRDGRREPYDRRKMQAGLKKALEKRPCTDDRFRALVNAIESDIQKTRKSEIASSVVGEAVMRHLRDYDSVAYIRFASVYRSFEDVETFQTELAQLSRAIAGHGKRKA